MRRRSLAFAQSGSAHPSRKSPSAATDLNLAAAQNVIHARAAGGRIGGPPSQPPVGTAGLPGGQQPGKNQVLKEAFQRGKTGTEDSFLSRIRHGTVRQIRETFITQQELKGSDAVQPGKSRTRFYAPAIESIRKLHSLQRDGRRRAQDDVAALFKNLTKDEYDRVAYLVFLRDAHENTLRGVERRPGFDAESIVNELNLTTQDVNTRPNAQLAYDSYQKLMHGVRDMLINEQLMSGENAREYYYPHLLIDYLPEQSKTTVFGKRLPSFAAKGTRITQSGNLKERRGSGRDINTNFASVLERYLTEQYVNVAKRRAIIKMHEDFDIRKNPKAGAKLGEQDQLPKGYVERDPYMGYTRLRAGTVAERYLNELIDFGGLDQLAKHYGYKDPTAFRKTLEDLTGVKDPETLAKKLGASTAPPESGKRFVIPEELARTLDNTIDQLNKAELRGVTEQGVRFWKTLVLNAAPVRYNFRNLIGDLQRLTVQFGGEAFQPEVWRYVTKSVVDFYRHRRINPLIQDMLDGGITSSTRIQSEYAISDVDPHLRQLEKGLDQGNLKKTAQVIWRVMKYLPEASAAREDIVRGVVLEMNKRRLASGKQLLTGMADRELVRGLIDAKDARGAAHYITRKSMLDYGDFTPRENKWRNGWFPFYAWASGNFQFWGNLAKRVGKEGLRGDAGDQLSRGTAAATLKGVAVTGLILGTIRVWNDQVMGEYEESLPENIKKTSHIIIPDFEHWRKTGEFQPQFDEEGKVLVWQTSDALDDFMTYLGLDKAVPEAMSVARGTLTKEEWLKRQREHALFGGVVPGKSAARAVLNQLGPREQILTQAILGKRMFPDPFNPADIPREQRAAAVRDVLGLSALPGIEGVVGASHPGGDVFQPTPKAYDVTRQLGFRNVQEPSYLLEGNLEDPFDTTNITPYEADLIKRYQQKRSEMRELQGRILRERAEKTNRQIDAPTREANMHTRIQVLHEIVDEMKMLSQRLQTLQRTRRFNQSNR